MEDFPDLKEDENSKIVYTYPLVQACDMLEEMKTETIEVVVTACEKFGSDYNSASKAVKQTMDRKYGPSWIAAIGEAYSVNMTYEEGSLMYMLFNGNLGICVWKI